MLITNKAAPFNYKEAYKSLRTNIKFISATENAKSFVITSALQEESKSNVSTNLAISLAEEGEKVVLVECDFRKPTIHRFLHMHSGGNGISDVLMGSCSIEEAIDHQKELGIYVLPVGTVPPNPAELMATPQMKLILDTLKKAFDYVIIDTPPVSVVTDAAIVGGLADGAFLVVRSDYAPVEMVQLAKKKLEDVHVKIFGIILTRFDAKKTGHQSGYYYSYNDYYYSYDKDKEK